MSDPLHVHFEDLEVGQVVPLGACAVDQAALDVFQDEPTDPARWADVPNVVLTPHIAGRSPEAMQASVDQAIANIEAWFLGKPLPAPVHQ